MFHKFTAEDVAFLNLFVFNNAFFVMFMLNFVIVITASYKYWEFKFLTFRQAFLVITAVILTTCWICLLGHWLLGMNRQELLSYFTCLYIMAPLTGIAVCQNRHFASPSSADEPDPLKW